MLILDALAALEKGDDAGLEARELRAEHEPLESGERDVCDRDRDIHAVLGTADEPFQKESRRKAVGAKDDGKWDQEDPRQRHEHSRADQPAGTPDGPEGACGKEQQCAPEEEFTHGYQLLRGRARSSREDVRGTPSIIPSAPRAPRPRRSAQSRPPARRSDPRARCATPRSRSTYPARKG